MTDEKKVLHGPWRDQIADEEFRVTEGSPWPEAQRLYRGTEKTFWAGTSSPAVVAELARLAAENAELRKGMDAMEATIAESADWLAERDQLRVLVARMRAWIDGKAGADWQAEGDALLADPDGQAAAEWLEAEKAKVREDERALQEDSWRAIVAQLGDVIAFARSERAEDLASVLRYAASIRLRGGQIDAALAWLADREAKARAAGRRQGLAEAAELVEAAGCTCYRRDEAEICAPQCPLALASMIRDLCPEGSELK